MTLFEALTGGAFDRLNWQHSGEIDQNFSKESNSPGFARGGGMGGFGIDLYITTKYRKNTYKWTIRLPKKTLNRFCLFVFFMKR